MKKKSIVIIAIVVLACVTAIIAVIWKNAPVQKQARQLELGNRYLEEMNYEQAKIVFEELINIDPSNVGAYLGAAKAYAGLEDYEGAVILLQEGYKQTGSEDIKVQMGQYEKKLEEKKERAKQELETEIKEYLSVRVPFALFSTENGVPLYTYTYVKTVYAERLSQLYQYLETNLSDELRCNIYFELHYYYLKINDMENAKKCWSQYLTLQGQTEDDALYDEYGRILEMHVTDLNGDFYAYFTYYEDSSLIKIWRVEYSDHVLFYTLEWDSEGRTIKKIMNIVYDDDRTSYEDSQAYVYDSPTKKRTTEYYADYIGKYTSIYDYDNEGHCILKEDYDEKGNLKYKWEFEYDEKGRERTSKYYDAGKLEQKVEYDTEGNVISSTTY